MPRPVARSACAGPLPLLLAAACALACAACQPPGPRGGSDPNAPKGEVITAEAIAATGASTIWDALRWTYRRVSYTTDNRGVPAAIHARGRSSIRTDDRLLVYIDGMPQSDLGVLAQMSAKLVERIEILSGIEASTYFGTNAGDGAINIILKKR